MARAAATRRSRSFSDIYQKNAWNNGQGETRAGPGSFMNYTAATRKFLGSFIRSHNITTVADLSCSEMLWQPHIPGFADLELFAGYDIVPDAIEHARERLGVGVGRNPHVKLEVLDMVTGRLPRAFDLVLVRDTLFHLPILEALQVLEMINDSGSRFLGTTTIDSPKVRNAFIEAGEWYPLNIKKPPFSFPEPLAAVVEGYKGVDFYGSKKLGVWKLPVRPEEGK